jgi:Ca-activated chloride channel family protein
MRSLSRALAALARRVLSLAPPDVPALSPLLATTHRATAAGRTRVHHGVARSARRRLASLLAAAALPACCAAVGAGSASPAAAAGLLVADGGFGGVLAIEQHAVRVTIDNGIAVTEVTQTFRNTEQRVVEALYTFPVPRGASVSSFSMWIAGKEMVGEVVERERARQIYDSYKQVGRDPGLLEQTDHKTFEMRIFPIAAGAEQRVRLVYWQELDVDADWATWVYPLATGPRGGLDARTQGPFGLDLEVLSAVPIAALESPSHGNELVVAQHGAGHVQASLEQTAGDLQRDVVVAFRTVRERSGFDLVASRERGEDGYFLLTLTAGEELAKTVEAMDYVFVLDVSGSMGDEGKLATSRDSLGAFVEALGPEDRFDVIAFNVAPQSAFGALRPAAPEAKAEAGAFLASQRARGGTFLEPALRAAYGHQQPDRALNVVILSDGITEQRERAELLRLAGERPARTRLFAIGIGNDVDRPLLEQLAKDAGGLAAFVSRGDDFDRQARAFQRKLQRPALTNIELELDGCGCYDLEPTTLPALYHGLPLRVYGRYRQAGPTTVTLRADAGGERIERTLAIEFPEQAGSSPVERMWASKRIERLLGEAQRGGERGAVVAEVVRLGEAFSIVSEHTSFLVLENDGEYQRWKIERRNALRNERDERALARLRQRLETLRRDGGEGIGPEAVVEARERQQQAQAPGERGAPRRFEAPAQTADRGGDVDLGGGGAFDPWMALLALGIAGVAWRRWSS